MKTVPGVTSASRLVTTLTVLTILSGFSLFSGCATPQKAYNGPYRDDGELCYIQPDREKAFTEVSIISVDDIKWDFFDSRFEILPGTHFLAVRITLDYPYLDKPLSFKQDISFETEAGHVYTVHGKIEPIFRTGDIWVTSDRMPGESICKWRQTF